MKKITILFLALLMVGVAYAAIPPHANMHIFYDSHLIEGDFSAEFFDCYEEGSYEKRKSYDPPVAPELDISEYDEENDCYWKPMNYLRSAGCAVGMCQFFPIPFGGARFAVYINDLDQVFITDRFNTEADLHKFMVFLKEDGSAEIEKVRHLDMEPFYAFFEGEEYIPPEPQERKTPAYIYGLILAALIIFAWLFISRKKKKK
jgi:hypothetical protein